MLNTRSFSDILIDQILEDYDLKQNPVASPPLNAGWESTLDPHGMAQILAQTETHIFAKANRHNPYKYKTKRTAPPQRPRHIMSEEQQLAFVCLQQFMTQLSDNFNLTELKTAYRRSALRAHPDHGGTSETFQNVKKSYQILTALVK
jgi:hypothetical protein